VRGGGRHRAAPKRGLWLCPARIHLLVARPECALDAVRAARRCHLYDARPSGGLERARRPHREPDVFQRGPPPQGSVILGAWRGLSLPPPNRPWFRRAGGCSQPGTPSALRRIRPHRSQPTACAAIPVQRQPIAHWSCTTGTARPRWSAGCWPPWWRALRSTSGGRTTRGPRRPYLEFR